MPSRRIWFESRALDELLEWALSDRKKVVRILELIRKTAKDPFKGTGKPEPLKHRWQGYWSRRIDEKHRLVYKVEGGAISIISCRGHYE